MLFLNYIDIFVIFEKADRVALAAGQEPQLSERTFSKTTHFMTYSTVTASGTARCDPPRHVDVIIQSFIEIWLM